MPDENAEKKLRRVLEAVAESIVDASDKEIIEELKAQGEDPAAVASRVRTVLLRGVAMHRKAELLSAEKRHDEEVERMRQVVVKLPSTADACRALLEKVLRIVPDCRQMVLTMQYRDLTQLTDEDVRGQLIRLAQLGFLDDPKLAIGEK